MINYNISNTNFNMNSQNNDQHQNNDNDKNLSNNLISGNVTTVDNQQLPTKQKIDNKASIIRANENFIQYNQLHMLLPLISEPRKSIQQKDYLIQSSNNKIKTSEDEIKVLENEIGLLDQQNKKEEDEINNHFIQIKNDKIQILKCEIKQLNNDIKTFNNDKISLFKTLENAINNEILLLEKKSQEEAYNAIDNIMKVKNNETKELKDIIQILKDSITYLEQKNKEKDDAIQLLKEENEEPNITIQALKNEIESSKQEIQNQQDMMQLYKKRNMEMTNIIKSSKEKNRELNVENEALNAAITDGMISLNQQNKQKDDKIKEQADEIEILQKEKMLLLHACNEANIDIVFSYP